MERLTKLKLFALPKFGRNSLDWFRKFNKYMGSPENNFKSVHVTGSNGKGTVCHKIAKLFQFSGFKTGLFVSPHLMRFNERISINGKMISDSDLMRIEDDVLSKLKIFMTDYDKTKAKNDTNIGVVIFDVITMIAFKYFEEQKVDYAVIEVGIGGRLDPTNIILPELSVITSISLEHTELLGNTVEEISEDKLGICKPNTPVVIGPDWPQEYMVDHLLSNSVLDPWLIHTVEESKENPNDFEFENKQIIEQWIKVLNREKPIIPESVIKEVLSLPVPGRFEKLGESLYYDAAHNYSAIRKGVATAISKINAQNKNKLVVVWGFTKEKYLTKNLNAILNHSQSDKIEWIILAEAADEDSEINKLLPHWISVSAMVEKLSDSLLPEKVKILNWIRDEETAMTSFTLQNVNSMNKDNKPLISGDVKSVLKHINSDEKLKSLNILVTGTFRLYKDVKEFAQS